MAKVENLNRLTLRNNKMSFTFNLDKGARSLTAPEAKYLKQMLKQSPLQQVPWVTQGREAVNGPE